MPSQDTNMCIQKNVHKKKTLEVEVQYYSLTAENKCIVSSNIVYSYGIRAGNK